MHYIPGLRLRCDEETEILGVDDAEMGEFAYDYVGLDAEIGAHLPHSSAGPGGAGADVPAMGAIGGSREPDHHLAHGHVEETHVLHKDDKRDSSSEGGMNEKPPSA